MYIYIYVQSVLSAATTAYLVFAVVFSLPAAFSWCRA